MSPRKTSAANPDLALLFYFEEFVSFQADAFELKERDDVVKASESETDVSKCAC